MTVDPASTRANRINSDSLDWSYIGISVTVGHSTSARRARGRSTADPPFTPDGRRRPALRPPGRVHLRGPRQCLRVDILPDVLHFAVSNGNGEDPVVLERLSRRFDFPRSDADDQNPVSLRHEFGGLWVCHFYLFGRLLKHSRQFRVPAVRAGQRPALTWNDPLNIFGNQRQQIMLVVDADCGKEILHNLNILFVAHRVSPFSLLRIVSDLIGQVVVHGAGSHRWEHDSWVDLGPPWPPPRAFWELSWVRSWPQRMQSFAGRAWLKRILQCPFWQTP